MNKEKHIILKKRSPGLSTMIANRHNNGLTVDKVFIDDLCPNSLKDIDWAKEHRKLDKMREDWLACLAEGERESVRVYEQTTDIYNLMNKKRPGIVS